MIVEKKTFITAMFVLLTAIIGVIFNSPIVCRMCVLLLFVICILRGMREKYFLNPYYMFALVPFTLLIYANISNYHLDLTVNTWLIAIINIAAFVIALDFTPEYKHLEKCKGLGSDKYLINHVFLFLIIGSMPALFRLVLNRTMPLASIFTLFSTVAMVAAIKTKKKLVISINIIVTIILWAGYVSKSQVLSILIALLISYEKYYAKNQKQKRMIISLSLVGLFVMILAFTFANKGRGSQVGFSAVEYYTKFGGITWNRSEYLLMPYMYMTTPWANLQYVIQNQTSRTYGLWLLKPLIGYLQLDDILSNYYRIQAYSNFNTFTYIAVQFKDFGFWGSCISSFLLGIFSKKVYSRFCISKSPLDTACYVLLAQAIIEMFFSNEFFTQSFPFTVVIITALCKLSFCRNCDVELEEED